MDIQCHKPGTSPDKAVTTKTRPDTCAWVRQKLPVLGIEEDEAREESQAINDADISHPTVDQLSPRLQECQATMNIYKRMMIRVEMLTREARSLRENTLPDIATEFADMERRVKRYDLELETTKAEVKDLELETFVEQMITRLERYGRSLRLVAYHVDDVYARVFKDDDDECDVAQHQLDQAQAQHQANRPNLRTYSTKAFSSSPRSTPVAYSPCQEPHSEKEKLKIPNPGLGLGGHSTTTRNPSRPTGASSSIPVDLDQGHVKASYSDGDVSTQHQFSSTAPASICANMGSEDGFLASTLIPKCPISEKKTVAPPGYDVRHEAEAKSSQTVWLEHYQ